MRDQLHSDNLHGNNKTQPVVFSWGKNDHGQLGLGHFENVKEPTLIQKICKMTPTSIVCGENHSMILNGI